MKAARLETLIGMIIASSAIGARGLSCGPCPESYTQTIPILPESSDGGTPGAIDPDAACAAQCPDAITCEATMIPLEGGSMPAVTCTRPTGGCPGGRRPDGLAQPAFSKSDEPVAGWLARAAFLEQASVDAFRALRRDLRAVRAPKRLLRAASRAARDEQRHARRMRAVARRHGAVVPMPEVRPASQAPTIESIARLNAAEGCVLETFGALLARWQTSSARDPELASAMKRIAPDEARHAGLAWEIDAWAQRRLGPSARARVKEAQRGAVRELFDEFARPTNEALTRDVGLPDRGAAELLARRLLEALGVDPRP